MYVLVSLLRVQLLLWEALFESIASFRMLEKRCRIRWSGFLIWDPVVCSGFLCLRPDYISHRPVQVSTLLLKHSANAGVPSL